MHTTIKTKISPNKLSQLFDRTDLVYIKYYKLSNGREIKEDELDDPKNFFVTIRHNENEDPIKVFNQAKKQI